MEDFKVGDVVQLKSGGPKMTITVKSGFYECVWYFGGTNTFNHEQFRSHDLMLVKE